MNYFYEIIKSFTCIYNNIIKNKIIFEIAYYITFIYVAFRWQKEAAYAKKLEERSKLLEKLSEISSNYSFLYESIHFLFSPIFLNKNTYIENTGEIYDKKYREIFDKISDSNKLYNLFRVNYINYFAKEKKDSHETLLNYINNFNLNINFLIIYIENDYTLSSQEIKKIFKESIEKQNKIFFISENNEIQKDIIFEKFEKKLLEILSVINIIENELLNIKI